MINQYDHLKEKVRLHEAIQKGKSKSIVNLGSLGMKTILQKNKEIKKAKKEHLSKVIQARKLKIKVRQIFNIKINKSSQFLSKSSKIYGQRSQNKNQKQDKNVKASPQYKNIHKSSTFHTTASTIKSRLTTQKKCSSKQSKTNKLKEDEGRINLFENFTEQQLNEIEQNENYYLGEDETISIFRKYMIRKRQNNKDYSYQKFGIKSIRDFSKEDNQLDKKAFILNFLGIKDQIKTECQELHLLTNPIEFSATLPDRVRSTSLLDIRSRKTMFQRFKQKQIANQQKIRMEYDKKILEIKIDRSYFDGLAAEKRAVFQDKKHDYVVRKNKDHHQKSVASIERIKTARENGGKSIQLAETIRNELLRRRTARIHNKH